MTPSTIPIDTAPRNRRERRAMKSARTTDRRTVVLHSIPQQRRI